MEHLVLKGVIAIVILVLLVIIVTMYVEAPPSMAYILSGFRKEPRVLIGGGLKIPVLERLDKVYLGQVTVDVKTSQPVPTHDFLDVMVDAVCKVRVKPDTEGIRLAAKNFLNMNSVQIADQVKDSLEGNMREVVGSLDLIKINTDRDAFSDEIQKKAAPDMAKLGLEILSCNIQNITDEKGLIRDLGADNTAAIQKNAKITRANADRDVAKAKADADKYQTEIDAQAALEKQKREAEAEAYKAEQVAKAVKAKAEASRYSQEQEAAGIRAKGEAEAYATQQTLTAEAEGTKAKLLAEAEGTKAKLLAEAEGVKAKGLAEAEAMQKKAEAYSKYGSIAVIDMLSKLNEKVLPDMAKYIAEPMSKIGNMTVYGTNGSEASGISGNVPAIIKQTRDIVKDATGVDMADIMKANTIDAKVNKNVNVNGDVENTNVNV